MAREILISDQLPWEAQITEGVVRLKDRGFLACLAYRGVDPDSMTDDQLMTYSTHLSDVLKRLGDGWTIQAEARRHAMNPYPGESPEWPVTLPGVFDEIRREQAREAQYFETRYILTFSWRPPITKRSVIRDFFWEQPRDEPSSNEVLTQEFDHAITAMVDTLSSIFPSCQRLTGNALLSFLHHAVTTFRHQIILEACPAWLDLRLATQPLVVGTQMVLGDTHHLRIVGVRAYPEFTVSALLKALDACPFEYRYCTRWVFWEKSKALRQLRFMQSLYRSAEISVISRLMRRYDRHNPDPPSINEDAQQKAMELGHEIEATSRELVGYGAWTASVIVMDPDDRLVRKKADIVVDILNRMRFLATIEGVNAADAWFGAIPGDRLHNPVSAPIHSLHAANLMPLTAVWSGLPYDEHWGKEPLMVTEATGGTPFRVVLHEAAEAAGHTLILGPTGTGKTVLMAAIMYNLLRFQGMRVVAFDRNDGLYAATRLAGGAYEDMGIRISTGDGALQPLSRLDQPGELAWMQGWIERMLKAKGVSLTPEQSHALYTGLTDVAGLELPMRTMTALLLHVQDKAIRSALTEYTLEGAWGALFDGCEDHFDIATIQTFGMGELLQSEQIAGAVMSWMLHRLDDFALQPMAIMVDELSFYLKHPQFQDAFVEWIKTARKKNWAVVGATQSIADVDTSALAAVLSEAFPNRIFLPNDRATEHYPSLMYRAYGLNDAEIARLARALKRREYYWCSPQGKRMFELNLSALERAVLAGNAGTERRRLQALGGEGDDLVVNYLRSHGFEALARAIEAPDMEPEARTVPSRMPMRVGEGERV